MATVIQLCGETPENYTKQEISSNPNFVFIPDDNFEKVLLYDKENNSVLVNSYVECEHYVLGGWSYEPIKNSEQVLQNSLIIVVVALLVLTYFTSWIFSKRSKNES